MVLFASLAKSHSFRGSDAIAPRGVGSYVSHLPCLGLVSHCCYLVVGLPCAIAAWRGSWNLLSADGQQSWTSHAASLEAAVERGVGEASEWLADQYAVVATDQALRSLLVEGVQNLGDYARVSEYLASLSPVEQVQVARVSGQEVEFSLNLNSAERNLLQVITLGRVLQAIAEPSAWRFRLNP